MKYLLPVQLYDLMKKLKRRLGRHTLLSRKLEELLRQLPDFSFIQVGANDGLTTDPYREFILETKGRGILVEPSPWQMARLRANYKRRGNLSFEELAVSYEASSVTLHVPVNPESSGVASLIKDHARAHSNGELVEVRVAGARLEDILEKHDLESVDCLFLDVEGLEAEILTRMDHERVGARLICFENAHLGERAGEVARVLSQWGYSLEAAGLDSIAWRG